MKNIYLLICLIFTLNVNGQSNALPNGNPVTFKGVVQDSLSNEVIPNANIRIYYNEQLVKRAVSNNNGEFKVLLPKGNYSYIISCVGFNYKKGIIDSTVHNNDKAFEIKLSEATNTTAKVMIKSYSRMIANYCLRNPDYRIVHLNLGGRLVINPSNYVRGPFFMYKKETQQ